MLNAIERAKGTSVADVAMGIWYANMLSGPITHFKNALGNVLNLSANIAVELPEAAVHSTHYRTLFLGAMVLFLLTFILNTAAELLRQRLREKFRIA
jgi:ABC-type uncharacterized transport system permease subunit